MSMTCFIYELSNADGVPFYIGSSINPKVREMHHRNTGKVFEALTVIDECPIDDRKAVECMYIQTYRGWGFELTNWHHNFNKGRDEMRERRLIRDLKREQEKMEQQEKHSENIPFGTVVTPLTRKQIQGYLWQYDEENGFFEILQGSYRLVPTKQRGGYIIQEIFEEWEFEKRGFYVRPVFSGKLRTPQDLFLVMFLVGITRSNGKGGVVLNEPNF